MRGCAIIIIPRMMQSILSRVQSQSWTSGAAGRVCRQIRNSAFLLRSSKLTDSRLIARQAHIQYANINPTMNSKHLGAGSSCPPPQEGKLRIYSMRFCPYAQRVLLVAEAKEIPHDIVNVNLVSKPAWLLERNPAGKVPTIDTPNGPLYESIIVSQYLDEIYPNKPLTSSDPYQKALDNIWMENSSKVTTLFYKVLLSAKTGDSDSIKARLQEFADALVPFEAELKRRGTLYFSGSEPGMLDYAIWPWFERLPVIKIAFANLYDFESAKSQNPNLEKWRKSMKEDKAVKASYCSPDVHHKFLMGFMDGEPNYDLLD